VVKTSVKKQSNIHWLSFVDGPESSGDIVKRRSIRWFLGPALFHQSQHAWIDATVLVVWFWPTIRCLPALDLLNYHWSTQFTATVLPTYTRWGIITGHHSFKRHNLVNIRSIYMKISDNIAEGMLSLSFYLSFSFVVAHAPFACQRWGLPYRLAQCATPGKGLV